MIFEILRELLLISGSLFIFIGAIGILNMPDLLCKSHALSKALTFGISLMLLSLLATPQLIAQELKIIASILFLFFTIPLSGHIFALYVYRSSISK